MKVFPYPSGTLPVQVAAAGLRAAALLACGAGLVVLARVEATIGLQARPGAALQMALLGAVSLAGWWWPIALGLGVLSVVDRWRSEGSWLALACAGRLDRWRFRLTLLLLAANLGGTLATTAWVEPWAARRLGGMAESARWGLDPGSRVELAGVEWIGLPDPPGGVLARGQGWTLVTQQLDVGPEGVRLGRGAARGQGGWAEWESLRWGPVPSRRIDLAERTLAELDEVVARTQARGGDDRYERLIRAKRWVHPLAASLAAVWVGALAGSSGCLVRFGMGSLAWVLLSRLVDGLVGWGIPEAWALAAPCWWLVLLGLKGWRR